MKIKTLVIGNDDNAFIVWVMKTHTGIKYICNGFELSCSTRDKGANNENIQYERN